MCVAIRSAGIWQGGWKIVARGFIPRAYPLRRPNAVGAPVRVDVRNESAHDEKKV
jgi:hypothetical protein